MSIANSGFGECDGYFARETVRFVDRIHQAKCETEMGFNIASFHHPQSSQFYLRYNFHRNKFSSFLHPVVHHVATSETAKENFHSNIAISGIKVLGKFSAKIFMPYQDDWSRFTP